MKNSVLKIVVYVFLYSLCGAYYHARAYNNTQKTTYSYILKLQLPQHLLGASGPWISYKGNPLSLDAHWCVIPERQEIVTCSVIISQNIKYKSEGNNVQYLYRDENDPCAWYDLTLQTHIASPRKKESFPLWRIEERLLTEVPVRIPENAIIVLINPRFVDHLEEHKEKNEHKKTTVRLPDIVIKQDVPLKDWNNAIHYSNLAFIDLKAILNKERQEIYQSSEASITLQRHPNEIRIAGN
ncbi:MAG: hypothetical protein WC707_05915 [Candidatus Babeliaceae bacterium]